MLPWDFYFYVGNTLLGLTMAEFFDVTPNHILKQYIMHLKYTAPQNLVEEKRIYTLDETPLM